MNQNHWIDKYYPKSLDSIIGNKDQINKLAALKLKHFQKIRGIQTHLSN